MLTLPRDIASQPRAAHSDCHRDLSQGTNFMRFVVVSMFTLATSSLLHAQPAQERVEIARNGKALMPVVLSKNVSQRTRQAAHTLAD
jgi:hypothetical protein